MKAKIYLAADKAAYKQLKMFTGIEVEYNLELLS